MSREPNSHPKQSTDDVRNIVTNIFLKYWQGYDPVYVRMHIERCIYLVNFVISKVRQKDITICDIGGSWGSFSAACAALGMKSILIDDFQNVGYFNKEDIRQNLHNDYGFIKIERDVIQDGIDFPPESIDVFTVFDVLEHFHHSPKKLFHQVMEALRPGGFFLLGVPNCVNLRKRITIPFGIGKWSSLHEWYEEPVFRGHVREPDVDDLAYIARDMGLTEVEIFGQNWLGRNNSRKFIRGLVAIFDKFLCLRASLCSDIYVCGKKARQKP